MILLTVLNSSKKVIRAMNHLLKEIWVSSANRSSTQRDKKRSTGKSEWNKFETHRVSYLRIRLLNDFIIAIGRYYYRSIGRHIIPIVEKISSPVTTLRLYAAAEGAADYSVEMSHRRAFFMIS